MGPIGYPETSVQNYHSTLRNIADVTYIAVVALFRIYSVSVSSMHAVCPA
jgi:hypothetical protein